MICLKQLIVHIDSTNSNSFHDHSEASSYESEDEDAVEELSDEPSVSEEEKEISEDSDHFQSSDSESDDGDDSSDDEDIRKVKCQITGAKLKDFMLVQFFHYGDISTLCIALSKDKEPLIMKRYRKDALKREGQMGKLALVSKIMTHVHSPFVLKYENVFKTPLRYYMFMQYLPGENLSQHLLNRSGLSLNEVKFLGAQILMGLDALHQKGFVHRNLNIDNILVDADGYVQLFNFKYASEIDAIEENDMVGDLSYTAPEFINAKSIARKPQIDWWSFGVLLYILHYKKLPFDSVKLDRLPDVICNQDVIFPPNREKNADKKYKKFHKLIRKLLTKNPKKRLGYSKSNKGGDKVRKASFFKGVDFEAIYNKEYDSPFKPNVNKKKLRKILKSKGCSVGDKRIYLSDPMAALRETEIPKA